MGLYPLYSSGWFSTTIFNVFIFLSGWRQFFRDSGVIIDLDYLFPADQTTIDCTGDNLRYRTLDGTCNSLDYPEMGSVGTRFKRMTYSAPLLFPETEADTLLQPNPRTVARNLLFPNTDFPKTHATHLNMFVAAWIQFMVHDWMDHGDVQQENTIDIPLDDDDPWYSAVRQVYSVFKTAQDSTYPLKPGDAFRPPATFQNTVTAWWDANQLYGTDSSQNTYVRDPEDPAKLLLNRTLDDDGRVVDIFGLYFDEVNNKEVAGFQKNWWLGLSILTELFAREHNYYVDAYRNYWLERTNTFQTDDEIFNQARLVISAMIAKIHTVEWTPAILGNQLGENIMNLNWYGTDWAKMGLNRGKGNGYRLFLEFFDQYRDAPVNIFTNSPAQETTASIMSYSDMLAMDGLISVLDTPAEKVKGGEQNTFGFYNFLEAFVGVYRFHALFPETFTFNCIPNITLYEQIYGTKTEFFDEFENYCIEEDEYNINNLNERCFENTVEMSSLLGHENTLKWRQEYSFDDVVYSFGTNNPTAIELFSYVDAMTNFADAETGTTLDLATIDIIRQRERGVLRYNDFRIALGMDPILEYSELTDDEDLQQLVSDVYADSGGIFSMDFLIGLLLENQGGKRVPDGWLFGETSFAIFIVSASNRIKADRFFTDYWNDETYSYFGRVWIERNAFGDILQRHFPAVRPFIPENAFSTWSDGVCEPDETTPAPTGAPTIHCPRWCHIAIKVALKYDLEIPYKCVGCSSHYYYTERQSSFLASDNVNISLTGVFIIFICLFVFVGCGGYFYWKRKNIKAQKEANEVIPHKTESTFDMEHVDIGATH